MKELSIQQAATTQGVSRRDFLKFCSMMAGVLAMPKGYSEMIANALANSKRTPVIWLEFQDCAGNSEALLRASRPTVSQLILDVLAVDYHETIMAAAGEQAEAAKKATIDAGGYLLVVEGSIPQGEDGAYCCIAGKSAIQLLEEALPGALAVVAIGSCAAFGGVPATSPNPTGAVPVSTIVGGKKPVLNLPGCPVNPVNLTATVVHFLTFGELPAMDDLGRPLFAYGARIHDNCPRRGHFDAGEFTVAWGDEGHRKGWCLYKMGCKGPVTFHNCPAVQYNDGTSWPIKAGHGCIACSEPGFWELGAYNQADLQRYAPPATYAPVQLPTQKLDPATTGVIGAVAGAAIGAAGVAAYKTLSKPDEEPTPPPARTTKK
ncbi:MAG: hydrogenase small subunit [Chloroflexi bacterium]|nr:hydrogenase small subunit [Chloroflexota bacterium]